MTQPDPSFRVEPGDGERVLVLIGELDMASTDTLSTAIDDVRGSGDITLDMHRLTFIDSSGIRALHRAAQGTAGGRLVLSRPTPAVSRVLDLVGLTEASPNVVVRP